MKRKILKQLDLPEYKQPLNSVVEFLDIERPQKIKVKYQNEQLETVEEEFDGIVSRCYQHELDHMYGRTFTELVSKLKLDMALKKRDKEIKRVTRLYGKKNT